MIRDINIPGTISGTDFQIWCQYDHDPGQPWAWDCAPLGESVEIIDMGIVSKCLNPLESGQSFELRVSNYQRSRPVTSRFPQTPLKNAFREIFGGLSTLLIFA